MLLRFQSFTLDLERLCLLGPAGQIDLRPKSFEVLRHLAGHAGRVVTKKELIKAVWPNVTVTDESLTRCISEVRHATNDQWQQIIKTVPRRGYLFDVPVLRAETVGAAAGTAPEGSAASHSLPAHPTIAVLAFTNLSGDAEQEYFCDGVTEDIITELSRFSELRVIARNSSFQYKGKAADVRQIGRELGVRYVLEGSIRRSGDSVRITGQLIDAATGIHRWAERFDRKIDDVFAIQDEIAQTIATLLAAHINRAEAERTLLKPPATWEAYDYFLRGQQALTKALSGVPIEDLYGARALLQCSIELDPNYARAYAALSSSNLVAWINPGTREYQSDDTLQLAYALALKAVDLEPNLPVAHSHLANTLFFRRELGASFAEWDKVFALNPNFSDWRYGQALVLTGKPEQGLAAISRHMRMDPFYPPQAAMALGMAYFVQKRYADALPPFVDMLMRSPHFRNGRLFLAATYAHMGRSNEARAQVEELLRIEPGCAIRNVAEMRYFQLAEDAAHMLDGLRKAGVPE